MAVKLSSEPAMQETPDDPESLSCIPSLHLEDIPRQAESVPTSLTTLSGAKLLTHDLFTNNIVYLEAALNLKPVPAHLLPLVPLFSRYSNHSTVFESPPGRGISSD